jgi:hypothetical protein
MATKNGSGLAYKVPSKNSAYIQAKEIVKDAPAPQKSQGGDLRSK